MTFSLLESNFFRLQVSDLVIVVFCFKNYNRFSLIGFFYHRNFVI